MHAGVRKGRGGRSQSREPLSQFPELPTAEFRPQSSPRETIALGPGPPTLARMEVGEWGYQTEPWPAPALTATGQDRSPLRLHFLIRNPEIFILTWKLKIQAPTSAPLSLLTSLLPPEQFLSSHPTSSPLFWLLPLPALPPCPRPDPQTSTYLSKPTPMSPPGHIFVCFPD